MSNAYYSITNSGGSALKVKVMFEGLEPTTMPLQNYERTMDGSASLNINATKGSFEIIRGLFKIAQTAPVGYATLAQVKTWMTSNVAANRSLTVVDDLGVSRSMIFINEYTPQSLSVLRDSTGNYWILPFELHEQ